MERERAKRWPPRKPFRWSAKELPEPAVDSAPATGAVCQSCGKGLEYQPRSGMDLDVVRCPCGYTFVVDCSGSLDRRADAIAGGVEAIQELMPR